MRPSSSDRASRSVRSVYLSRGKAVRREPVRYSSTDAGVTKPSMSGSERRRFIRCTSAGSVRPSSHTSATPVPLRRPSFVS